MKKLIRMIGMAVGVMVGLPIVVGLRLYIL
jgi:hypothetical protein